LSPPTPPNLRVLRRSPDFEDGDSRKYITRYSKGDLLDILQLAGGLKETGKKDIKIGSAQILLRDVFWVPISVWLSTRGIVLCPSPCMG